MKFKEYFSRIDYFIEKRIGISCYSSNYDEVNEFTEGLEEIGISYEKFASSEILQNNTAFNVETFNKSYLVFYQDLSLKELGENIESVVNEILYPIYFKNIPIALFSSLPKTEYKAINIKSGLIHEDFNIVVNNLLFEQIYTLFDPINLHIDNRARSNDDTKYTPIELILRKALESNRFSYQSQVKLGRHYVDFIVEKDNRKLIVECDGREYHNPFRDKERDKELDKYGIPILRFSGSEIFLNSSDCIEKINNFFLRAPENALKQLDENIDKSQSKPIAHINGACRVLAPAGSGKTKTLVNRIINLINNGVEESNILALAFNKMAAVEMRDRLDKRNINVSNKLNESGVAVRTFHSFGYQIIRESLQWNFNPQRELLDTRNFLRDSFNAYHNLPGYKMKDAIDKLLEALRKAKMELIPIEELIVEIDEKVYPFQNIFDTYLEKQKAHNFFNYDDMIYLSLRILLDNGILRNILQKKYQYILVDEFQDLNEAQLLLMQLLSLPENNLFIVGDDDQMIYGWRGAKISHILNFPKRYKTSKDYTLSTNYRSSKSIVNHSSWLIKNNTNRVPKDIKPKLNAKTGEFMVMISENLFEQAQDAVKWINDKKDESNATWGDFAVLYRYHEYQYPIALLLDSFRIPHSPINNYRLFVKNPGKDLYAYLTVLLHPNDSKPENFARILKYPNKYFSNDLIANARDWNSFENLVDILDEQWRKDKVSDFINDIKYIQSVLADYDSPAELIQSIYDTFDFKGFYEDRDVDINEVEKASDDIIMDVILAVSKTYNTIDEFYFQIYNAINEPYETPTFEERNPINEVHLTTIHSTKGNEFAHVIYFNLSESDKNFTEIQEEEERRVCYVGVTRAINNLFITALNKNYSKFLLELIRNPKFIDQQEVQLNGQLSTLKYDESLILGKIESYKSEIESIKKVYPELTGTTLQINKELLSADYKTKITSLERKYPELIGEPLKSDFFIFKAFFTKKRAKKVETAKKKVIELHTKIEKVIEIAVSERQERVNNATGEIQELNEKITEITNGKLIQCRDSIYEIQSEIKFRDLIPV